MLCRPPARGYTLRWPRLPGRKTGELMPPGFRGKWKILLGVLVLAAMFFGFDSFVNSQVFYPDRENAGDPGVLGISFRDEWIQTPDGTRLHAWWLPAKGAGTVLLFCHGNAGNITHRLDNLALLNRAGVSVLIFDYRGYGKSQGKIDERGFYEDTLAALARARELARGEKARLVVFGRSLGGIAASRVAAEKGVAGVILESTFTNLGDMAKSIYPLPGLGGLLAGRLAADRFLQNAAVPLLFLHGDCDDIVPLELGRKLYETAKAPKEFMVVEGAGHNDTFQVMGEKKYAERIRAFLDGLPTGPP